MPATCVIGLQWGDEAKGKVIDYLAPRHEVVVRYLGGANAGHTVVVGGEKYKLHHIPSGILAPNVVNVVATGVVVNPPVFLQEIDSLMGRGIHVGDNLMLSDRAHVVCPWHFSEDRLLEGSPLMGESIGTTLRGIGPCYRDKAGRSFAIRVGDMYREDFRARIERIVDVKRRLLAGLGQASTADLLLDPHKIYDEFRGYADRLQPFVRDTTAYLLDCVEAKRPILFEGAQGTMLDIDHGTFPFVTSSNSSSAGVSAGAGVPPRCLEKMLGVAKVYTTRVGGGPFPTEQDNEIGQTIRDAGGEFGTTTGRPRRCGWFDAVAVRYAVRLGGIDALCLMKLDVLSALPELRICVAYEREGARLPGFPSHVDDLRRVCPIYEVLPGWQVDIRGVRRTKDLPSAAARFATRISELVNCPVEMISVGPDREQTVLAGSQLGT